MLWKNKFYNSASLIYQPNHRNTETAKTVGSYEVEGYFFWEDADFNLLGINDKKQMVLFIYNNNDSTYSSPYETSNKIIDEEELKLKLQTMKMIKENIVED